MDRETEIINMTVGIKWNPKGVSREQGFDCWSFFKWFHLVFKGVTIDEGDGLCAGQTSKIVKAFSRAIGSGDRWVQIKEPTPFCAVALSTNNKIHHVGVWAKNGCLHAVDNLGVVYSDMAHLKRSGYSKVEFYECRTL